MYYTYTYNFEDKLTRCILLLSIMSFCISHSVAIAKAKGLLSTCNIFPCGVLSFLWSSVISNFPSHNNIFVFR